MQNHRNPFSILCHMEILKRVGAEGIRTFLEKVLPNPACHVGRNRIFDPVTTTWLFVLQTLDADQSCRQVVARFLGDLAEAGERLCSLRTGAYCRARKRLSESFLHEAVRKIGALLTAQEPEAWRWRSRVVKIIDGAVVSMPDTIENQAQYPQYTHQKKGIGFPQARLLVVFSLSTGALLEAVISRVLGKGSGETSLFRSLRSTFKRGEVLLFDRLYTNFVDMAYLQSQEIDFVGTLHIGRQYQDNIIEKLGSQDWLACFPRPPAHMIRHEYKNDIPDTIIVRITEINVKQKGFRTKKLTIASSFIDERAVSKSDLADLYRQRWQIELDIRKLKSNMQMDILRCKSPEMIRKEIWAHLLAYNLTCALVAEAAARADLCPMQISFKSALQIYRTLYELLARVDVNHAHKLVKELIAKLATEQICNRPERVEPRAVKRRPKDYPRLMKPRTQVREELLRRC